MTWPAAATWNGRIPAPLRVRLRASSLQGASAAAFAVLAAGAGLSYVAQVLTARIIGAESFGIYAYVLAWVTLLSYLGTLGLHVSLLRLAATYRARDDWPMVRGVLRFATLGTVATGTLIVVAGLSIGTRLADLESELALTFAFGLLVAPLLALQLVGAATVRVFGGVASGLVPERLLRDGCAVLLLGAVVGAGLATADAATAMGAMLASAAITLWAVRRLARRLLPQALAGHAPAFAVREWLKPALPLTLMMLADVVMARTGVIVLGATGDTLAAGVFAVAFGLATLISLPRMAVAAAFAPTVADLYARNDLAGLQALTRRAAQLSLAASVAVAVPLAFGAPFLLGLFGPGFAAGVPAVTILIVGQVVAAAAGPQQHLVTMTGHEAAGPCCRGRRRPSAPRSRCWSRRRSA